MKNNLRPQNVKVKGNEKYELYSIQLQCHSTSHSTQPNPTHGWTQPMSISGHPRTRFLGSSKSARQICSRSARPFFVRCSRIPATQTNCHRGRPHIGANGVSRAPWKMDEKLKSENMQKEQFSVFMLYFKSNQGRQV